MKLPGCHQGQSLVVHGCPDYRRSPKNNENNGCPDYRADNTGKEGIDAVIDWEYKEGESRQLLMEAKCFGKSYSKSEIKKKLYTQLIKHAEENVLRSMNFDSEDREGDIVWQRQCR